MSLDELKQQSQKAIIYSELKEAGVLVKDIEFQLGKLIEAGGKSEEIEELVKILVRLKMLRLALLSDGEVYELIKEKAITLLEDPDMDLAERIEARLLVFPESLRTEMVNQPIIEALHQNMEMIGDERILVQSNPNAEEPTVQNWLADYDRTFGTEPQKNLVWLEYVNSGANSLRLDTNGRELLRKLIKLYEFLKLEYVEE